MRLTDPAITGSCFAAFTFLVLASRGGRWRYLIPHRHLLARRTDRWVCLRCPRTWERTDSPPRRMGRI